MKPGRTGIAVVFCIVFALGLIGQSPGVAQPSQEAAPDAAGPVGLPGNLLGIPQGAQCTFVDFEGLGDLQPVGTVAGTPQVTFGPSWLGLIDSDAGGSGNTANEPSPETTTVFLQPADSVNFDTGVQYIEIFYSAASSSLPMTLSAWDGPDGTGSLVDSVVGNTVGTDFDGANCSGDPNGNYCFYAQLVLSASSDTIVSMTLSGAAANFVVFDDMLYCTAVPVPTLPSYRWAIVLAVVLLVASGLILRGRFA